MKKENMQYLIDGEIFDNAEAAADYISDNLSEAEYDDMLERQRLAIAIAKREGKYKGRKPIAVTEMFFTVARAWESGNITLKDAVAQSGVSEATFFRRCKQYNIGRGVTK